jgi:hypothetical protein
MLKKRKNIIKYVYLIVLYEYLYLFVQQIYEQTKKDFEHIDEKYIKAKKLIKELQDR